MDFKEYLERERGNLTMLISTILAWVILNWYDYFNLVYWIGIEFAFVVYLLGLYFLYLIIFYIPELIVIKGKIKINQTGKTETKYMDDPKQGNNYYGFLEVEIPKNWIIRDCYVTIERVTPIYFSDRKLIDRETQELHLRNFNPEYKLLRWKSPLSYHKNRKIDVGENSNREDFSVGKIVTRILKTSKVASTSVKTFDFDDPKTKEGSIHFKNFGLYEFSIVFHWRRNGRKMKPKKTDGYIYTKSEGDMEKIIVGIGDYKKNKSIPKPLLVDGVIDA